MTTTIEILSETWRVSICLRRNNGIYKLQGLGLADWTTEFGVSCPKNCAFLWTICPSLVGWWPSMRWGLHGCPEEKDVDLIDGKIQESTPGVRDIWTETRPHDAVPSWPVSSIELLSAKDETLSVRTVVQACNLKQKCGQNEEICGQIIGIRYMWLYDHEWGWIARGGPRFGCLGCLEVLSDSYIWEKIHTVFTICKHEPCWVVQNEDFEMIH
jgi:hypothetical protein